MIEKYSRDWDGSEWEEFSLGIVRLRHGAQNVQPVPATVKGDYGIECITTDGCCYQSYAPQETSDVGKAASAMKSKATRDLQKLAKYASGIEDLLAGRKISRWILLCPFLDNKEVVAHVAQKASEVHEKGLPFLDASFCGLVHSQQDFANEISQIRLRARGASFKLIDPDKQSVLKAENRIDQTLELKLARGFSQYSAKKITERKFRFLRTHIRSENALERLKRDAPDLWDKAATTIAIEEDRLATAGVGIGDTASILTKEQDRLYAALELSLPTLDSNVIRAIAMGQIGTWLIECPLDFESGEGG